MQKSLPRKSYSANILAHSNKSKNIFWNSKSCVFYINVLVDLPLASEQRRPNSVPTKLFGKFKIWTDESYPALLIEAHNIFVYSFSIQFP
jgi:hypothetical protein